MKLDPKKPLTVAAVCLLVLASAALLALFAKENEPRAKATVAG